MLRQILPLSLISAFVFLAGCAVNPVTGKRQLMLVPAFQEIQMGREYAPEVERQMGGAIADQELQNYINSVGQKVAAVAPGGYQYTFTALNHDSMNAMALPGGPIFITRGMLRKLESESQLAAILTHEVVHVAARHSADQISRQIGVSVLLQAIGDRTPQGVAAAAELTSQLLSLSYSREHEREADVYAVDYLISSGYDPQGIVETMQILQAQDDVRGIEFFSTHPNPANRVQYLKDTINDRDVPQGLRVGREDYRRLVLDRLR